MAPSGRPLKLAARDVHEGGNELGASRVMWMVGIACFVHVAAAHAQAIVEAVQYPAWLERGDSRVPLAPGTKLQARDAIVTGSEARVAFRLAEGSIVRLGEKSRVVLQRDELVLASGAFRLTSAPASGREVGMRAGEISILGRGADLWGEAGDRDQVLLISGRARVQVAGHSPMALERPLDRYEAPRGGVPAGGRSGREALALAATRVEVDPDGPRAVHGGRWRVFVGKFESGLDARALQSNLHAAGFPADIIGGGSSPFIVLVPGLAGEAEARSAMARLRGIDGAGILTVNQAN